MARNLTASDWGAMCARNDVTVHPPHPTLPQQEVNPNDRDAVWARANELATLWHPKSPDARRRLIVAYCGEINRWRKAFGFEPFHFDFNSLDAKGNLDELDERES